VEAENARKTADHAERAGKNPFLRRRTIARLSPFDVEAVKALVISDLLIPLLQ